VIQDPWNESLRCKWLTALDFVDLLLAQPDLRKSWDDVVWEMHIFPEDRLKPTLDELLVVYYLPAVLLVQLCGLNVHANAFRAHHQEPVR